MSGDIMTFPDTWEEYEQYWGITDTEEIYTNGARLIPSFRVKQWLDHVSAKPVVSGVWMEDGEGEIHCSRCGKYTYDRHDEIIESDGTTIIALCYPRYCGNCGADMRICGHGIPDTEEQMQMPKELNDAIEEMLHGEDQ